MPAVDPVAAVGVAGGVIAGWFTAVRRSRVDSGQLALDSFKALNDATMARLDAVEKALAAAEAELTVARQHTVDCEDRIRVLQAKVADLEAVVERRKITRPTQPDRRTT